MMVKLTPGPLRLLAHETHQRWKIHVLMWLNFELFTLASKNSNHRQIGSKTGKQEINKKPMGKT